MELTKAPVALIGHKNSRLLPKIIVANGYFCSISVCFRVVNDSICVLLDSKCIFSMLERYYNTMNLLKHTSDTLRLQK